jgi:stage III sporulation protein AF
MSVIGDIVRNLLVIIIVASFLEVILPDGSLKPLVRFTIGLFIIIAILNPVVKFLGGNPNLAVEEWDQRINQQLSSEIVTGGESINQQISDQTNKVLKEKIQGQISAVAVLVPGVEEVDSKILMGKDGVPQKLQLTVRTSASDSKRGIQPIDVFSSSSQENDAQEQDRISNKIRQVISNLYGLEAENIEVDFEGG